MSMDICLKRCGIVIGAVLWSITTLQTQALAADGKEKIGPEQRPSTEKNWQIGFTPSYSSGNFGTDTTSTFVYAPWSLRRFFRDGDVTLVIPFVSASTDGRATLVGGNATQIDDDGGNSGQGGGGGADDGGCSGKGSNVSGKDRVCGTTTRAAGQTVRTAGLGDIVLRGRYYAVEERDFVPLIALTARMKFPTANEKLGLGTGEFDHGYGVELSKMLGQKWITFLDGGYNFLGNPNGLVLRDQYWYDVGAGYYLTKDLLVSGYFEEYRAPRVGRVNIRDFYFAFNYRATAEWRFNGGVAVGVSNGAPDYVVSLGTSYRF
ncbi:MAG: transporter [Nitrospira sp.]|nr:transporter [Nitrospira sp.]